MVTFGKHGRGRVSYLASITPKPLLGPFSGVGAHSPN